MTPAPISIAPCDEELSNRDAFTVIDNVKESRRAVGEDQKDKSELTGMLEFNPPSGKNVNIVKPLRRIDDRNINARHHQNSANRENMEHQEHIVHEEEMTTGPQTILDPIFSRALQFKLKRLKENDDTNSNFQRPPRFRPSYHPMGGSNPNINDPQIRVTRNISNSNPNINTIGRMNELRVREKRGNKETISPRVLNDKSPVSPDRRSKQLRKISESTEILDRKPRFITTVKKGSFLLPPPEMASLLGLESLYPEEERAKFVYSYSSKPKVVPLCAKKAKIDSKPKPDLREDADPGLSRSQPKVCSIFRGVRSLVSGVVGLKSQLNERDLLGPMPGSAELASQPYGNMMHDRRIVRGSTIAPHHDVEAAGDAQSAAARAAETRRRALARRKARAARLAASPPPVPGRRHEPVQTEVYLEELFEKGEEMDTGVQTDLFLDRPVTPIYVPAKTGKDVWTQIYPGDLFDFDSEVQPIVSALVDSTLQQSLAECLHEEELASLRERQRRLAELREAERDEYNRLDEQDKRIRDEKERRISEASLALVAAAESRSRAAAAALVRAHVADLLPEVLAGLERQGHLPDAETKAVEEEFLPWLLQQVSRELECMMTCRDVITDIVREVVEERSSLYRAAGELQDASARARASEVELGAGEQSDAEFVQTEPGGARATTPTSAARSEHEEIAGDGGGGGSGQNKDFLKKI